MAKSTLGKPKSLKGEKIRYKDRHYYKEQT